MEHVAAAQNYVALNRLRRQLAQYVRSLPGVATLAESDLTIRMLEDGSLSLDCTLTTYQNVQLYKLGAAVQKSLVQQVRELAGMHARVVNVYIYDIDERSMQPLG